MSIFVGEQGWKHVFPSISATMLYAPFLEKRLAVDVASVSVLICPTQGIFQPSISRL